MSDYKINRPLESWVERNVISLLTVAKDFAEEERQKRMLKMVVREMIDDGRLIFWKFYRHRCDLTPMFAECRKDSSKWMIPGVNKVIHEEKISICVIDWLATVYWSYYFWKKLQKDSNRVAAVFTKSNSRRFPMSTMIELNLEKRKANSILYSLV